MYAVRLNKCKVVRSRHGNNELFYLKPPTLNLVVYNVLQISQRSITLKEYVSGKAVDGFIDCWVTP